MALKVHVAHSPTRRWWRWRRNPLRRRSDVVEAWTVLVLAAAVWIGLPAAGLSAGAVAYSAAHTTAVAQRASSRPVDAVVIRNTPPISPSANGGGGASKDRAAVRWTEADGTSGTGIAKVDAGSTAGQHVRIWLDTHGRVVEEPLDDREVWLISLSWATIAAMATTTALLGVRSVVRRCAHRHRMAEWELAWARTEPEWRRPRT
ncbi:hypothetical protein [Streptomyces sp. NBC_00648]|uniref:Rv1733c family protein n=1 Tax=Streptomyces sp. NBC_00648 TaxID=2975797 RepID=UPI003247E191